MRCDMMPFLAGPNADRAEQARLERGLMYVAMTRAEEMLAFTRSSLNGFASRIQQLLDQDGARPHYSEPFGIVLGRAKSVCC